jgi:hypothetical protein
MRVLFNAALQACSCAAAGHEWQSMSDLVTAAHCNPPNVFVLLSCRRAPVQLLDMNGRAGLLRTVLEAQETRGLTRSDDISRLLPAGVCYNLTFCYI